MAVALRGAGYLKWEQANLEKLAKLLGAFVMVDLYFFGCDLLTEGFPGGSGLEVVAMLTTGPLAPYFWVEIIGCAACAAVGFWWSARCLSSPASSASACSCWSAAFSWPTWTCRAR